MGEDEEEKEDEKEMVVLERKGEAIFFYLFCLCGEDLERKKEEGND